MRVQQKNARLRRPPKRPSLKNPAKSTSIPATPGPRLSLSFHKTKRAGATNFVLSLRITPPVYRVTKPAVQHQGFKDVYYPELIWNWLRSKAKPAYLLIVIGVLGILYFSAHLQKPTHFNIEQTGAKALAPPAAAAPKSMPASPPVELKIPKIGLDTLLKQTGTDANGAVAMPWDIEEADWYKYSPSPGQIGPSIIVGHLDGANYANMAGVFYKLNQLAPGDQIIVSRADGTIATFKVLYLNQVPQNNFPTKQIYGNINYAGIRLITCGGTFDPSVGHYSENTVVYGALE